MTMDGFKILSICLVFISGCIGGLLPLRIRMTERGQRLLDLGNAFAGGIFLGAGFIHLLGDAVENFGDAAPDMDYPLPFLLCGLAFLSILAIEKVWMHGRAESAVATGNKTFYPFLLLFVLSLHSTIAGLSLGLEQTLSASFVLLIAILAHKSSAAFALGVSLRKADMPKPRFCGLVALFSVMTPLGIGLGALFAKAVSGKAAAWGETLFDSLAAGTFLYIAVLDILDEVFGGSENRVLKFSLTLGAFLLMATLALWT